MRFETIYDIVMVMMVLFMAGRGFFRGFVNETFSLIGVLAGAWLAIAYSPELCDLMQEYVPTLSDLYGKIIAVAVIFIGVTLLCTLIGNLMGIYLKYVNLSLLDKWLGLGIGVVKALVILLVCSAVMGYIQPHVRNLDLRYSHAYTLSAQIWPHVEPYVEMILPDKAFPMEIGEQ